MAAYVGSKAAVAALTQALAAELAPRRILVNAIAPSIIDTPANRAAMPRRGPCELADPGGDRRDDPLPRLAGQPGDQRRDRAGLTAAPEAATSPANITADRAPRSWRGTSQRSAAWNKVSCGPRPSCGKHATPNDAVIAADGCRRGERRARARWRRDSLRPP
jgi:NAD(P)-dependent dehydrogenase (short-subunit alcohol dehydrogenase family)